MFEKYDAYKDSGVDWLGEIPNSWNIVELKRVVKEHSGNGFPIELQGNEDGNIPFLKVSDISGELKLIVQSSNYVTDKIRIRNKWNLVPKNSIVTGKIGEALRKNHRKILLEDSIIDNNCIGIEAIKINYNFNYYLHKVIDFEWFVNPGAIPSISVRKYKSFKICLPSENEQYAIVKFLDQKTSEIDQAIAIKEQQIALLNEHKQIVIQKAVTQGLDSNVPMKDSGVEWIGIIPKHWEILKIRYLGTTQNGISAGGDYFGTGYPFVSYGDVYKNRVLPETVEGLAKSTLNDQKSFSIQEGDIFFTRTSETIDEIGFTSVCFKTIENAVFAGFLIRFRPFVKAPLIKEFSKYYFSSPMMRAYFVKEMNLVIRASLSQELLKNLDVLLPSIEEQMNRTGFVGDFFI